MHMRTNKVWVHECILEHLCVSEGVEMRWAEDEKIWDETQSDRKKHQLGKKAGTEKTVLQISKDSVYNMVGGEFLNTELLPTNINRVIITNLVRSRGSS